MRPLTLPWAFDSGEMTVTIEGGCIVFVPEVRLVVRRLSHLPTLCLDSALDFEEYHGPHEDHELKLLAASESQMHLPQTL